MSRRFIHVDMYAHLHNHTYVHSVYVYIGMFVIHSTIYEHLEENPPVLSSMCGQFCSPKRTVLQQDRAPTPERMNMLW